MGNEAISSAAERVVSSEVISSAGGISVLGT